MIVKIRGMILREIKKLDRRSGESHGVVCGDEYVMYSAGQKTVVKGCASRSFNYATFDHVFLASRVHIRICILFLHLIPGIARAVYVPQAEEPWITESFT